MNRLRTSETTDCLDRVLLVGSKQMLDEADIEGLKLHCSQITDWQLFLNRAAGTHLAPILAASLSRPEIKQSIPDFVISELQNSQKQVMATAIILQDVFQRFATVLNENEIPVIPLKGIYLTEAVYHNIGFRHLSDIDVLVNEDDLKRICSLMAERGFESKHTILRSSVEHEHFAHAHPVTLEKGSIRIELHTHLYNQSQDIKIGVSELWNNVRVDLLLGVSVYQFSKELVFQHLCLHLHKHLFGHELKLVSFCDLREFLQVYGNAFSWVRFGEMCRQFECEQAVYEVLYLTHRFWEVIEIPVEFRNPNRPTSEIEERFWSFFHGKAYESGKRLENRMNVLWMKWNKLDNLGKLKYVSGQLFPTEDFMRRRYGQTDGWIFPWYVYRPFEQFVKAIKALASKSVGK